MNNVKSFESKVDDLINLMLTLGVQPSELADNIFLNDYQSIKFYKRNGFIIGELLYREEFRKSKTDVLLRYFYDNEKKVVLIEEEINGQITVLWDREYKESEILNEIFILLKKNFDRQQVANFLAKLPDELTIKIMNFYENIA